MLSIYVTTELQQQVQEWINSEPRLNELIDVVVNHEPANHSMSLLVNEKGMLQPLDWENTAPPILLDTPISLTKEHLLGVVYAKLENFERAFQLISAESQLGQQLALTHRLQYNHMIDKELVESLRSSDSQYQAHNLAVTLQYGYLSQEVQSSGEEVFQSYQKAIADADNVESSAFSALQYATLLMDINHVADSIVIIDKAKDTVISEEAQMALTNIQVRNWTKQLTQPYDEALLTKIKDTLWSLIQYYEGKDRMSEAGLLYTDACHIANISESYTEALGYITKAINIFSDQGLEELKANAILHKGTLLYTWAQDGNPQFYKPAVEAYQEALKVFKKDVTPDVFADIHHNLAMIYAEMPTENKKKGIWAGVSVSSFQEALDYYTKENFPYEYGMICNNYGSALTKYPQAIHSDNYEKALYYYQESLNVRGSDLPQERAITILNYLEASWKVGNDPESFNQARYEDMLAKAQEIKTLTDDPELVQAADEHLGLLDKLKEAAAV